MGHVFLSYASQDRERVRPLASLLGEVAPVWWDEKIRLGDHWEDSIEKAVADAGCIVVAWTADSVQSGWVKSEAADARDRGILVPVLLDPVKVPLSFRHIETAQLQDWNGSPDHPEAQALKAAVAAVIARAGGEPVPTAASAPARPPPPRTPPGRSRAVLGVAAAVVGVVALAGYLMFQPTRGTDPVEAFDAPAAPADSPAAAAAGPASDTAAGGIPRDDGEAARLWGVIVTDGNQPTLEQTLATEQYLHYVVDVDGQVHAPVAGGVPGGVRVHGPGDTLLVGLVHLTPAAAAETGAPYQQYPEEQIDGLVELLAQLAFDGGFDADRLRPGDDADIGSRFELVRAAAATRLRELRIWGAAGAAGG